MEIGEGVAASGPGGGSKSDDPPKKGTLRVKVLSTCGDALKEADVQVSKLGKQTDASGVAEFADIPVGPKRVDVFKAFPDADYAIFLVHYPRSLWRSKAESKGKGNIEVTSGATAELEVKIVVYRLVDKIVFKRKHIHPSAADKYGHWWTEIDDTKSYGWWPKYPLGDPRAASSPPPTPPPPLPPSPGVMESVQHAFASAVYEAKSAWHETRESAPVQTFVGVDGELNGQTAFGGTATVDPHHGDSGDEEYQAVADDCRADATVKSKIDTFAAAYRGGWSWRFEFGNHCHTFQKALINDADLKKFKVIK